VEISSMLTAIAMTRFPLLHARESGGGRWAWIRVVQIKIAMTEIRTGGVIS